MDSRAVNVARCLSLMPLKLIAFPTFTFKETKSLVFLEKIKNSDLEKSFSVTKTG